MFHTHRYNLLWSQMWMIKSTKQSLFNSFTEHDDNLLSTLSKTTRQFQTEISLAKKAARDIFLATKSIRIVVLNDHRSSQCKKNNNNFHCTVVCKEMLNVKSWYFRKVISVATP